MEEARACQGRRPESRTFPALAERAWTELLANGNALAQESIPRRLGQMKAELAGPQATPLERLLVDLAGICWLAAHQAELAAASPPGGSLQQAALRCPARPPGGSPGKAGRSTHAR